MGITNLLGINNLINNVALPQTSEADDSNTSALLLLGLLPAPLRLLLLFLIESTGCTALVEVPPMECEEGEIRETYSGPPGTEGAGVCRPRIEECVIRDGITHYEVIQEEVLPSEEICDGVDNDCSGPSLVEEWSRTFSGETSDSFYSVQLDSDGDFVLVGNRIFQEVREDGSWSWRIDAWAVKTDNEGNEQWRRIFGGDSDDHLLFVQPIRDGGYVFAGNTRSYGAILDDAWLIRTDNGGNELWSRTFGDVANDYVSSLQQTSDGGFVLAGYSDGSSEGWLLKTDDEGFEQWRRTFAQGNQSFFYAAQQTTDGGFILAGQVFDYSTDTGNSPGWLVRTDESGHEIWGRTYGDRGERVINAVWPTEDGSYLCAGRMGSSSTWVTLVDNDGGQVWDETFSGSWYGERYPNGFSSIYPTSDGSFIVVGYSDNLRRVSLLDIDETGETIWLRTFGGEPDEQFYHVLPIDDHNFLFVGSMPGPGEGGQDARMVKVCME